MILPAALCERDRLMNCAHCQRTNDEEAIFCVYCGVRMDAPVAPAASRPATGATIDLGRPAAPTFEAAKPVPPPVVPARPAVAPPPPAPTVTWERSGCHPPHPQRRSGNGSWVPFLVMGLIALVLFKKLFIVGIVVLLCILAHGGPRHRSRSDGKRHGGSGMIWLIGIPVLFMTGWWPGILILIGLSALKG
jgi:hypothetical protein